MTTSVDTEEVRDLAEIERNAYNAAFYELGLRWHWDTETYTKLQGSACVRERIRTYLQAHQPHLLRAYDAEFLIDAIEAKKASLCAPSSSSDALPYFDWAQSRAGELGV